VKWGAEFLLLWVANLLLKHDQPGSSGDDLMFLKSSVPMNILSHTVRVIFTLVVLVASSHQSFAQKLVAIVPQEATGSIVNFAQNKIMMKVKGVNIPMEINPKARIAITGTAELDFIPYIKAPLMLQFTTDMNSKNNQPTGKIAEMEIVSASEKVVPGMVRDIDTPAGPDAKKLPPAATYILQVTGGPQSYKNGVLQIGGKKFEIDPAGKINVKCDSLSALVAIPPNQDVDIVIGYQENPMKKPMPPFYLLGLKYELPEPLSAPKKGGKRSDSKLPITKATPKSEDKKDDKKIEKQGAKDEGKANDEAGKEKANEGKKK
jgi:hypothetical protein